MEDKKKIAKISWWLLVAMWTFVAIGWLLWGWWIEAKMGPAGNAGEYGDLFGGVNALFSGLAFATLIFTAILQKNELELQRAELTETREVMVGQREQMELQNKTLSKQTFEATFFQWLSLHHELVSAMEFRGGSGRAAFVGMREELRTHYLGIVRDALGLGVAVNAPLVVNKATEAFGLNLGFDQTMTRQAFDSLYATEGNQMGHYFRNFYNALKFVANSNLPDRQKRFYTNIWRAQLSTSELVLIFYNGLSEHGLNAVPYYEKFSVFNNLDPNELLLYGHRMYYQNTAYAASPDRFADET